MICATRMSIKNLNNKVGTVDKKLSWKLLWKIYLYFIQWCALFYFLFFIEIINYFLESLTEICSTTISEFFHQHSIIKVIDFHHDQFGGIFKFFVLLLRIFHKSWWRILSLLVWESIYSFWHNFWDSFQFLCSITPIFITHLTFIHVFFQFLS